MQGENKHHPCILFPHFKSFLNMLVTTSGFQFIHGLLLSGTYVDEIHFTTTPVV